MGSWVIVGINDDDDDNETDKMPNCHLGFCPLVFIPHTIVASIIITGPPFDHHSIVHSFCQRTLAIIMSFDSDIAYSGKYF